MRITPNYTVSKIGSCGKVLKYKSLGMGKYRFFYSISTPIKWAGKILGNPITKLNSGGLTFNWFGNNLYLRLAGK